MQTSLFFWGCTKKTSGHRWSLATRPCANSTSFNNQFQISFFFLNWISGASNWASFSNNISTVIAKKFNKNRLEGAKKCRYNYLSISWTHRGEERFFIALPNDFRQQQQLLHPSFFNEIHFQIAALVVVLDWMLLEWDACIAKKS